MLVADQTGAHRRAMAGQSGIDSPMVRLDGVGLTYGQPGGPRSVEALREVSFAVERRQFVSIVGLSGCGKSTLLKIVSGLLPASGGDVRVAGMTPAEARRQQIFGVVFQSPVLLPWRNALENIALLLEVQGVAREERQALAHHYLELVGLAGFEKHAPRELSGGMQQRVSIARALTLDPEVLLMDEPFGALDALTRDRMAFELLDICQRSQKTVMFVTHSVSEAVLLSDAVVVLTPRPGRVQAIRAIDLPRPRTKETRMTPEFTAYTHQLLRDLEGQTAEDAP
jgi:NitT/TauT family transport system ATP-binding protein